MYGSFCPRLAARGSDIFLDIWPDVFRTLNQSNRSPDELSGHRIKPVSSRPTLSDFLRNRKMPVLAVLYSNGPKFQVSSSHTNVFHVLLVMAWAEGNLHRALSVGGEKNRARAGF